MASTSSAPAPIVAATPPSIDVNAHPPPVHNDGFLRPASPRKRRRSLDRAEPSTRTLESQVRDKLTVSPTSPIALTGANEMAEQKRRKLEHNTDHIQHAAAGKLQSPNPRQQALGALRGSGARNMSKPGDGPPSSTSNVPTLITNASSSAQASPTSNGSFGTALSATAGGPQVASPTQMDAEPPGDEDVHPDSNATLQPQSPQQKQGPYTYPDPRLGAAHLNNNARNHSVAGTQGDDTRSPGSNKKHKCPYCETEFTRHHNLKSHLLTHSQEKPYLCQQCDMRFRRLHDLKRHTKLHTGDRPHVCPICNRKFARGDALARHQKGAGGCAGHRASIGSFNGDGTGENEIVMTDLMSYTGNQSEEPGEIDENDVPGRPLRQAQYSSSLQPPRAQALPQTYPPAQRTGPGPYLQTPAPSHGGTSSPSQPPYGHTAQQGSYPPPFHGNMTESPGPISPSSGPNDPRRSSMTSQLRQYATQGTHAHNSPQVPTATMGLPPPGASVPSNAPSNAHYSSQLPPPLPSITTDPRGPAHHGHAHNASGSYQSAPGSASTHNSLSSHGQGSGERAGLGIDEKERLYAIIHEMKRHAEAQDSKINTLMNEVENLKKRMDKPNATSGAPAAS